MENSLEFFKRLRNKMKWAVYISWSYALKELWIIDRDINDLDIVTSSSINVTNYLYYLIDTEQLNAKILNEDNIDLYWQAEYIKLQFNNWEIVDILFLEYLTSNVLDNTIYLEKWFISPRIIKSKKQKMIKHYKKQLLTKEIKDKIKKHQSDIEKIDIYYNLIK